MYVQGKRDVENVHRNMKLKNVKAKQCHAQTVKARTAHGLTNAQSVSKKENKEKYYGINYLTSIHHDDNTTRNTTE